MSTSVHAGAAMQASYAHIVPWPTATEPGFTPIA